MPGWLGYSIVFVRRSAHQRGIETSITSLPYWIFRSKECPSERVLRRRSITTMNTILVSEGVPIREGIETPLRNLFQLVLHCPKGVPIREGIETLPRDE